jgi:hypothetical protein
MHGREGDVGVDAFHYVITCQRTLSPSLHQETARFQHTYDGILEFTGFVEVEKLAGAQRELHALVVLLELVVDFGGQQRGKFPFRE